ncbi:MAG: lipopolysaccharide biosynthesis protein [Sphingobium sp.]
MTQGLSGRLRAGMVWSMLESWGVQVVQFLTFVIVARYVDAVALGTVATALLVGQFFQNFVLSGISTPLVRGGEDDRELQDAAFWIAAGAGVLLLVATLAVAMLVQRWTHQPDLGWVLGWLGVANLLSALNLVPQAWLTRRLMMRPLAMRSTLSTLGGGVVGVGMAVSGYGVDALVAQNLVVALLGAAALWTVSPWRPRLAFSREKGREIFYYGRHMAVSGVANFFNANSDVLVVTMVLGAAATGIYTVGKRALLSANLLLARSLSRVALPTFAHLRDDPNRLAQAYLKLVSSTAIITMPAFVGMALVSEEFILLFFGERWQGAVAVMYYLSFFGALQAIGIYNQSIMLAMGKPQWQAALATLYAVVNLLSFFVAARYGVAAVALAFTVRAYLLYPLSIWAVVLLLPIRWSDYWAALRLSVIGCVGMMVATTLFHQAADGFDPLPRMIMTILCGMGSYSLILLLLGRRELNEMLLFALGRERRSVTP